MFRYVYTCICVYLCLCTGFVLHLACTCQNVAKCVSECSISPSWLYFLSQMAHYLTITTVDSVLGVLIMINWIIEILQTELRHLACTGIEKTSSWLVFMENIRRSHQASVSGGEVLGQLTNMRSTPLWWSVLADESRIIIIHLLTHNITQTQRNTDKHINTQKQTITLVNTAK